MKNALRSILMVVAAALFVRCITTYDAPVEGDGTGSLVVEGVITDEETIIILSRSFGVTESSAGTIHVPGAKVVIESDSGQRFEAVQMGSGTGRYAAQTGTLDENTGYRLYISYEGEEYVSEYRRPQPTPPLDTLELHRNGNYLQLQVDVEGEPDGPKHFLWSYEENWEIRTDFDGVYYLGYVDNNGAYGPTGLGISFQHYYSWIKGASPPPPEVRIYKRPEEYSPYQHCWSSTRSQELLLATTEMLTENTLKDYVLYEYPAADKRFSYLYHSKVTQYALGTDAYYYLSNLKKNTDETGSIFAPIPSEMKGNIACISSPEIPIIGFVEVSKRGQHEQFFEQPGDVWPCETFRFTELARIEGANFNDLYLARFEPGRDTLYANLLCIDCRKSGGGKIRPDWWPNDHR